MSLRYLNTELSRWGRMSPCAAQGINPIKATQMDFRQASIQGGVFTSMQESQHKRSDKERVLKIKELI